MLTLLIIGNVVHKQMNNSITNR